MARKEKVFKARGFYRLKKAADSAAKFISRYTATPKGAGASTAALEKELEEAKAKLKSHSTDPFIRKLIEPRIVALTNRLARQKGKPSRMAKLDKDSRKGKELMSELLVRLQAVQAVIGQMEAADASWGRNDFGGKQVHLKRRK